jgi:predicted metalloprotease with PDZ domain
MWKVEFVIDLRFQDESTNPASLSLPSLTEPMDTIFVKSVRENGPAFEAGLRTGNMN